MPKPQRFRPIAGQKLNEARNQVTKLLNDGIVRRSNSKFAAPIHLVPKKNGTFRMVGDYRLLNLHTEPDRYTLPRINDILQTLHGAKVFSTIDIERAYHQIPMHPADIEKTAIITPFGLFEYLMMPFGLRNAGATFQRFMDSIFSDVEGVSTYMDDILVVGETTIEHDERLSKVYSLLKKFNLPVNLEKCHIRKQSVQFLGHSLTADGVSPLQNKVKAISEFPRPTNQKELRRFVGMINFYHQLIPNCSHLTSPLTSLLTSKSAEIQWNC